ncbi:MAG: hypothetical protein LUD72_01080 [Bacteroidales bacterium]|nr:hypothetical protein [Bacteroidales bacterium]
MKTYVLTLSRTFPKGHPREGEETDFADRVRRGLHYAEHPCYDSPLPSKIHTIRANYELWKKRIDEVNAGKAVLSVRQWLGAPRRSKQREIFRFDRDSGIGVERLEIIQFGPLFGLSITDAEGRHVTGELETLVENDGLSEEDWMDWFRGCDKSQPMAIIHFTNFRYCK